MNNLQPQFNRAGFLSVFSQSKNVDYRSTLLKRAPYLTRLEKNSLEIAVSKTTSQPKFLLDNFFSSSVDRLLYAADTVSIFL